jgi:hypothetical protein
VSGWNGRVRVSGDLALQTWAAVPVEGVR